MELRFILKLVMRKERKKGNIKKMSGYDCDIGGA